MKQINLLIGILILSLLASCKIINISPQSEQCTLELFDECEEKNVSFDFDKDEKNVTITGLNNVNVAATRTADSTKMIYTFRPVSITEKQKLVNVTYQMNGIIEFFKNNRVSIKLIYSDTAGNKQNCFFYGSIYCPVNDGGAGEGGGGGG